MRRAVLAAAATPEAGWAGELEPAVEQSQADRKDRGQVSRNALTVLLNVCGRMSLTVREVVILNCQGGHASLRLLDRSETGW